MFKKVRLLIPILFLICSSIYASTTKQEYSGTGFQRLSDSVFIFYPSDEKNTITEIAHIQVNASENIAKVNKKFPVIIMSHGTGAGALSQHHLISELTKYGFVVVTLTHQDDNFTLYFYRMKNIYTRVSEISNLIDQLATSSFVKHLDFEKINFIGYSAGGLTGLFLSGAKFDFNKYNDYLNRYPDCVMKPGQKNMHYYLDKIQEIKADPRIKNFVLLAPAAFLFSDESLAKVTSPILVIGGEKDEILEPKENFIALIKKKLTNQQNKLVLLPNQGHFVFLAPCDIKSICAGSEQRAKLMPYIAKEINNFLKSNL